MVERKTFRLAGENYNVSPSEVEERMRGVSARPLGKYRVRVGGVDYPPKQVIAVALGRDLISFTTMDASRILTALGFEVSRTGEKRQQPLRNESEMLFEQYLSMSGLAEFDYEKQFPGKAQRPDYVVKLADEVGSQVMFEIKEFRATADDFRPGGGAYDPYLAIREKIQQAREKFRAFKDSCCCLVLFNREKPLVDLSWRFVFGAMLGNLGFRIPFDAESGVFDHSKMQQTFTVGGEMLRYKGLQPIEPQNRTISAILVLDLLPVGRIRFEHHVEQLEQARKAQGQPKLELEEYLQILEESRGTDRDYSLTQLRGVVHENPHARIKFPPGLFRGPYDERYGRDEDRRIGRLYAGSGILRLEGQGLRQEAF